MTITLRAGVALAAMLPVPAAAQLHHDHTTPPSQTPPQSHDAGHPGAHNGQEAGAHLGEHPAGHHKPATDPAPSTEGSGTSRLPGADGAMHGLHASAGDWTLMAHGYVWGFGVAQEGPRGAHKLFATSMAMLTAGRDLSDNARLSLRSMLSLDPLLGRRGYPSLLASGETAFGEPLVDRQHPHDFVMELAARVDLDIAPDTTAFLYGGPVAEPALGPSAFMHRGSARLLPLAPISHHWFDSTHITYGVVTAGLATARVQLEASAFRGREPDEERWGIETPHLDSWSVRATWTPSTHWALQLSHGRLEEPEAQHPGEDERRITASVHYAGGGVGATLAFSAKDRLPGPTLLAWLGEVNWDVDDRHSLFGRVEHVENDELVPDETNPMHDRAFRVSRAELGYAYRLTLGGPWRLALGGTVFATGLPGALKPAYGGEPIGGTVFAKVSLGH